MLVTIILLVLIGLFSAILGSLVGIGGIIIVPTLGVTHDVLHGITPQIAIGTSSVILIVTGLSSSLGYLKTKQVDIKMVLSSCLDYYQVHC